ncbi:MAG TPA: hypothetical protein VJ785_07655 [Anaerolineales bacterium]|nr:hypothetical protein [Anaerolineales bacterium]
MGNPQLSPEEFEEPLPEALPRPQAVQQVQPETPQDNKKTLYIIIGVVVLLVLLGVVAISYLLQPATPTDKIRDVLIIFVAIESLVIGVALVILIIQIASLTNLLQNEVKPILITTKETVNTLRGTTEFLSENAVEPVIKLQGYLAGFNRILELLRVLRK